MKIKSLIGLNALAAAMLTACGGGDINLNPSNTVTDSNSNTLINEPGTGTPTHPCATFALAGQVLAGNFSDGNCACSASLVSGTRPLPVDLSVPPVADGGLHIFVDTLFVGDVVDANS